ncbi:hypothetical protein GQS52_24930 [Streptomyces sp. SCUT-3]|uniref:NAD(P)/FAD-dependent oxidoreductase n=1 Tax=Streptomyces sp. SCUT-3 TaxID=2684469 RepID=UPI0015FBF76C|nr:FAD-dependent oxidoreductase [Streptomyces sp. SCUT-3]QMV24479.1 hypothetical protein GQS52_24930 [Streptomyces sp. SCUT-3]
MDGQHIVVVGAGYAGLAAATRAGRRHRVTLIAPESHFLHRVRSHETAAGLPGRRPAIAHLLRGRDVTHLRARVTGLDPAGGKVTVEEGPAVGYDTLVYALGSRTAWHGVPGAAEHTYPAERADELARRIGGAERPGTVAVVGGGATGIELAAELAEAHPQWRVRLVTAGEAGGWLSERGRAHVLRVLERLGVRVEEHAEVTAVDADGLHTSRGPVGADVVVWAASLEPHPLAAEAGLEVAPDGRAVVDGHLRSVSHPGVYVVGDAAAVTVPGVGRLRAGCATAQPMGVHVGNVLGGRAAGPFRFRYVLQCLSLGRRDGLVQTVRADDSMRPAVLTGAPARWVKAAIVNGVLLNLR